MKVRIKDYYGNNIPVGYTGEIGILNEDDFPNHTIELKDGTILHFIEDESMRVGRHVEFIDE